MPEGTGRILDSRTLASSHRRLSELLRPGLSVLDVGCGTGAITRGIAKAVGPAGRAVGVDINADLIAAARIHSADTESLSFQVADIYSLPFTDEYDIVAAARVIQWLSEPEAAITSMIDATRGGGRVLILDYNHEKIEWKPSPPRSMQAFYSAFLRWRSDAGMDNAIANHLYALFQKCGLAEVVEMSQCEATNRAQKDFISAIGIWADVAASRGRQMVKDGFISETERSTAETEYRNWIESEAES